ncbi:hypothetical protein ACIP3U_19780 [[Kitasatospora] papulosa]|uniref:hypothetical protein n=2 Tax=Streptomyces TaxID=1883 RepID=UPI0026CE5D40
MEKHTGQSPPKRLPPAAPTTVHATFSLGEGRGFQFVEFEPGMTGVIQSGRVMADTPIAQEQGGKPPEVGQDRAGEGRQVVTRDAGEQTWFKQTFCNGAQSCVQGWDWALATSKWKLGNGTGICMVGSEGTVNAKFTSYYWKCACTTPFCIGGPTCLWIEFWEGVVLPGHWLSVDVTGGNHYIQWTLNGAGADTQVSLAARYGS